LGGIIRDAREAVRARAGGGGLCFLAASAELDVKACPDTRYGPPGRCVGTAGGKRGREHK